MALRIDVKNVQEYQNKKIFFDANIFIFLFCPLSQAKEAHTKKYSTSFSQLLKSQSNLFSSVSILSEFVNRFLKLSFERYKVQNKKETFDLKRDYRQTDDFKETYRLISQTIRTKICKHFTIVDLDYNNDIINGLIMDFEHRYIDFNDLYIEKICIQKKFALLTDDADFTASPLDLITGNGKLLN